MVEMNASLTFHASIATPTFTAISSASRTPPHERLPTSADTLLRAIS